MEESIFKSIKALLGPDADYDVFDPDILIFINSAIATLTQLGIGPEEGFVVTGENETWDDFLGFDADQLQAAKTFVYLKVKMVFDPPSSSFVLTSYEKTCEELAWRLNVAVDPSKL